MKINWKLRLKNKYTLTALVACLLDFVYSLLAIFGIVPAICEEELFNLANAAIGLLVFLGIIVDPTTEGVGDSTNALSYDNPKLNIPDLEHSNTEYKG